MPNTVTIHNINGSEMSFRKYIEDLLVLSNNEIENFLKKTKIKYSHHSKHVKGLKPDSHVPRKLVSAGKYDKSKLHKISDC